MSFLTYIGGAFILVAVSIGIGFIIALCVSEMDSDGTERRESERGEL